MRIVIGSDHAGLELKNVAASWISNWGHEVLDAGAYEFDRDAVSYTHLRAHET